MYENRFWNLMMKKRKAVVQLEMTAVVKFRMLLIGAMCPINGQTSTKDHMRSKPLDELVAHIKAVDWFMSGTEAVATTRKMIQRAINVPLRSFLTTLTYSRNAAMTYIGVMRSRRPRNQHASVHQPLL